MERLIKAQPKSKFQQIVAPGVLRHLDFSRLQLDPDDRYAGETGEREMVVDLLSGVASVKVKMPGGYEQAFLEVGGRADVFSGPPAMLYLPPRSAYEVHAGSAPVDALMFSAPSQAKIPAAVCAGSSVVKKQVGRESFQRTVYHTFGEEGATERLLPGETLNAAGCWSSYPPHKHDCDNPPQEAFLEEVYFFRIKPAQGFGYIRTYTAPDDPEGFDNVFVVEDGDTVLIPKGYHPVVAAPGYQLHYTWVLAGEKRAYGAWAEDPRHAWVKNL